jgi:HK97 family phage prohead protease
LTLNRAFSELTVRSVDEEKREIRGIATTPRVDRQNDIVEPLGCKFTNPVVMLMHHDHKAPVGRVTFGTPTKSGIPFTARLPKDSLLSPGTLRDRVQEAWDSIKAGFFSVSIGFRVLNNAVEQLANGGLRFLETEIFELSLCTVPAQPDAQILEVRANRNGSRRQGGVVRLSAPKGARRTSAAARVVRLSVRDEIERDLLGMVRTLPLPLVMKAIFPTAKGSVLREILARNSAELSGSGRRVVKLGRSIARARR